MWEIMQEHEQEFLEEFGKRENKEQLIDKYKEVSSEEFIECFFGENPDKAIAGSAWNSLGAEVQTRLKELWDADFAEFLTKHIEAATD